MNTNEKVSQEELKEVLNKNPEFAKKLMAQQQIKEASSVPVKIFKSYEEAKSTLGFLEPTMIDFTDEDKLKTKTSKKFGSGIIKGRTQLLPYFTGKNEVSFPLDLNLIKVANGKNEFNYTDIFEIARILLIKKDEDVFTTVTHVDLENLVHVGKHYLYKFSAVPFIKGHENIASSAKYDIYVNASPENKSIKIDTEISDSLIDTKEEFYIAPIVISWYKKSEILANINDMWNNKKSEFLTKLTDGYTDKQKEKISVAIDKVTVNKEVTFGELTNDVGFSKGMALYYLDRNEVSPIQDGITENSGDADYLNIVSNLYPKYGEEWIDLDDVVLDNHKMPVLNASDLKCLKIVGVTEELAKNIYASGITSLQTASETVDNAVVPKNELSDIAEAECRLIVVLDGDNWKSAMDNVYVSEPEEISDYDLMLKRSSQNSIVADAQKTIYDIKQQFAVLQKTAKRIELKVNSGEFSNIYMVLCNEYFYSLYKHTLNIEDEQFFNSSVFPMFIELFNDDYKKNKDFLFKKIRDTAANTINCNTSKDKFGNSVDNLFDKFASIIDDFVDFDAIPNNLSDEESLKAVMDQVFIRFKYIDNISKTPYKFVIKLCPELSKVFSSKNDDFDKAVDKSKEYASQIGLNSITKSDGDWSNTPLPKYKTAHDEINESIVNNISRIKKAYLDYLKVLNENKSKHRMDKARTFAKFAVYFTLYAYIESIDTKLLPVDEKLSDENIKQEIYIVKDSITDKEISKEDYLAFDENKRKNYTIFKKLNSDEVNDLITDYYLRVLFLSAFVVLYTRLLGKYENYIKEFSKNKDLEVNASKMLVSELGLFVPSIAALEYPNFTSENLKDKIDFKSIIPIESKIKLGSTAVDNILKDLDNPEKLIEARKRYLLASSRYSENILNILSDFD